MKISGLKRDTVIGGWEKMHNEKLYNLCSLPSIIRMMKLRRMRWGRHVAQMGKKRNAYRILVERLERKRPLGRPSRM
jgi:hypothetical protein